MIKSIKMILKNVLGRNKNIESDVSIFSRAESILEEAIHLGNQGKLFIIPKIISVSATDNCNLKCIMCPGHKENYGTKLSIDEADMLFKSLIKGQPSFGSPRFLEVTAGEPTLNRAIGPICAKFKNMYPGAQTSMITNATIPPRGDIREAFVHCDRIGISIDGATQETYERIRQGAVFKNVMRNVKDIVEIKKANGGISGLEIMFVAMDQNIHELPEMVKLTHLFGIPTLFAQVSEVRWKPVFNFDNQNITLDLNNEKLSEIIHETKVEAKNLGINLILTPELENADKIKIFPDAVEKNKQRISFESEIENNNINQLPDDALFKEAIKTCKVPWFFSPHINIDDKGFYIHTVCCHMPKWRSYLDFDIVEQFRRKSITEIFNSGFYWKIRQDLLNGSLAKACSGCQYYKATQWTANKLKKLEKVTELVRNT